MDPIRQAQERVNGGPIDLRETRVRTSDGVENADEEHRAGGGRGWRSRRALQDEAGHEAALACGSVAVGALEEPPFDRAPPPRGFINGSGGGARCRIRIAE